MAMTELVFPEKLAAMGYTEEGLDKDNPFNLSNMELIQYKNPIVIYHGNCADGFSAAWCFHNIQDEHETAYDFHPGVYNEPPPDVEGRVVYLVDFSYKRAVLEEMLKTAKHIILIDHHKTAIDDIINCVNGGTAIELGPNFSYFVDIERSGAMLAWDFLHNLKDGEEVKPSYPEYKVPPLLIKHIQDRDLWRFAIPNTREIQAAVFSYEYTFEIYDSLMAMNSDQLVHLAKEGTAIERKHFKDIKELLSVCTRMGNIGGYDIPIANLPYTFASDAGHILSSEYKEGSVFAATYYDTATHRIFSLRSNPSGVDVSGIAKQYNGGGHRNAAGFRVDRTHALATF